MSLEDQHTDCKSLRFVTGRTADWNDIARACVCFANGAGGRLLIGIEDAADEPPAGQVVPPGLMDRLRKRVGELAVNVQVVPRLRKAANAGEYIELTIVRASGRGVDHRWSLLPAHRRRLQAGPRRRCPSVGQ